jgi:gp16 family phage-associated protein
MTRTSPRQNSRRKKPSPPPVLLTREQARKALESRGESVADFARARGLDAPTVYQVLYGTKKGRRGEAHRAAVALGIKSGEFQ